MRKRISRVTAEACPGGSAVFGTLIGASVGRRSRTAARFCGFDHASTAERSQSLTDIWLCSRCSNRGPSPADCSPSRRSSDCCSRTAPARFRRRAPKARYRPTVRKAPERVQLNKALVGFLTHTGYTHGGNGYEGIAFLIEAFRRQRARRSGRPGPWRRPDGAGGALGRAAMRTNKARTAACREPRHREAAGREPSSLQGQAGQPRPARGCSSRDLCEQRGEYNVFHAYLPRPGAARCSMAGVSRNVYCVNVDAVIAALLLKMLWQPLRRGEIAEPRRWKPPRSRSSCIRACSAARRKSTIT